MTKGAVLLRMGFGALALLLVAAVASVATTPAGATESCWGCVKYECDHGFPSGAYSCEMGEVECSLVDKIFFGCKGRYCRAYDPCPLTFIAPPHPDPEPAGAGCSEPGTTAANTAPAPASSLIP